ncbi:LytTR family two component transcriptional regulator [Gillisia sp. Hel_I_86]|uniref:LytR/AlgR family response regulator transcription factor n=1 Tax=Gillisia sp. Hel_I_86 TaxID=1249981 RepID=UPI001199BE4F|nr:LytTR family DNA-binding domain-containing protein [Gillisia sp. Hel_I_86]TVZ28603.1 LytTR family two component transcriptional regulator [Gillisia sp. Hel_I_86]
MKALIVDDETLARKRILNLLSTVEKIRVVEECSNGKTAIQRINELKPDLVFLDINMKDMNGFEVLQKVAITPKPIIVFVTAYDHYALKAFDYEAFDFLLKPYRDERFYKTIDKLLNLSQPEIDLNFEKKMKEFFKLNEEKKEAKEAGSRLPVKQGHRTILLDPSKIKYICASGYYAEIYTEENKYVLRESLKKLIKILNQKIFFRIHRSAIVNINYIQEIVHSDYSEMDVRMKDNKLIRVSKSNKKGFLLQLGI